MNDMSDKLILGKIEFEHYNCTPESINQFLIERKREELKCIVEILESFKIDKKIIKAVIFRLSKI